MRRCMTLQRRRRRSISRCLGSFWSCSKTCCELAAIFVNVGYHKMIVRCRTTSHDIVRRRWSSNDICAVVVRRRRATSSMIYDVLGLHIRSYDIARPSYDRRTTSQRSHDYRATLIYKTISTSHHVKSYVIVRLSFDCRTMLYDLHMI